MILYPVPHHFSAAYIIGSYTITFDILFDLPPDVKNNYEIMENT